jgi:hypothetical protein
MLVLKRGGRCGKACLLLGALALGACGSSPDRNAPAGGAAGTGGSMSGGGAGAGAGPTAAAMVGSIGLRRLNRFEYGNTLRDLVGASAELAAKFPLENLFFGFDNIGEALTVQPLHIELYEENVETALTQLFARPATDSLRARFVTCDAKTVGRPCILQMLSYFAQWAFRRPVIEAEVRGLADIAQDFITTGGTADDAMKVAFKGVLLSPHFIYRVELDPDSASKVPHRVSGFELATRLSYYLWSTMPDQQLLVEAQGGNLTTDVGLAAQVERMLNDPRSTALIQNFAGQWLNLRRIEQVKPDTTLFPSFDDSLRSALRGESEAFFMELFQKGRPVNELLSGTYTYVNERLARHYGIPAPVGDGFQRVELAGTPRLGFLTHGSFLTATSNPTRTSPVKRGQWVLDQLLCSPPPPPPAGVDLAAVEVGDTSVRARLEAHRAKEPCRSCHAIMDPIGLSFENYDAIGTYRTSDQYGPIDATGELMTEQGKVTFKGANELVPVLADDPRLMRCFTQKLLTYAVGRGFSSADAAALQAVTGAAEASGKGVRGAFASVAMTEAFRSRRAVGE